MFVCILFMLFEHLIHHDFLFNFHFRFGDLSDFKLRISWLLDFSFATLKTLAHFDNLERCCNAWFDFRKLNISSNI